MDALNTNKQHLPDTLGADRLLGQTVGQDYVIEQLIGSGARGKVYVAYHKGLQSKVAIKFLLEEANSEHLARFRQEGQALLKLKHENIVSVRDFGYYEDRPFLVMDLVDGISLDRILVERGRFDDSVARSIFLQAAAALDHAHQQGILHRDVKPANIMLSELETGAFRVSLVDFGLAKVYCDENNPGSLTQTGAIAGTPQYMSPEQCSGSELDPRTDIYSLGCVMYEAVTGRRCVDTTILFNCLYQQINDVPPPFRDLEPPLQSTLEHIIFRCLEKNKERRYASAADLYSILSATMEGAGYQNSALHWLKQATRWSTPRSIAARASLPAIPMTIPRTFDRLMASLIDSSIVACLGTVWFAVVTLLAHIYVQDAIKYSLPPFAFVFPALLIDWFAGGLLLIPLMLVWSDSFKLDTSDHRQVLFAATLVTGLYLYGASTWIYRAFMESSKWQSTPGKMMLGLLVTDEQGMRLSFSRALLRTLCRPVSLLIVPDLTRFVHLWLSNNNESAAQAFKRVVLKPGHDWLSRCQVQCCDDANVKLKFLLPITCAMTSSLLAILSNGKFFVATLLATFLVGICSVCWLAGIHRVFMIARARHPQAKIMHPWFATGLNIIGLCLIASIQILSIVGPVLSTEQLRVEVALRAAGVSENELALTRPMDRLALNTLAKQKSAPVRQNKRPLGAVPAGLGPLIAGLAVVIFSIYALMGVQLHWAQKAARDTSRWLPLALSASLAVIPLLWILRITETRILGLSLGFLLAFISLAKLNSTINSSRIEKQQT